MENVKSSHGMGFSKLKKIEALPLHDVYIDEIKYTSTSCEGCFCNNATQRAKGDHDVDLSFKRG